MATQPITWNDVAALSPRLRNVDPALQTMVLGAVAAQVDPACWGGYYQLAAAYLAAHVATVARLDGKGPITAEGLGPGSRSYADLSANVSLYATTTFGLEFRRLARLLPGVLGMVV